MPSLNWIGKEKIVNHDKDVPFRLLRKNKKYSLGKSENLILEGDNLEALKALMPFYYGKIKCIYIDPPYNTGNEKWRYNDRVNAPKIKEWLGSVVDNEDLLRHDKWLCMMYPRLKLLYDLLHDKGVIFISIDGNEFHNLRIIMDEIFRPECFVGIITWFKKRKGSYLSKELVSLTEYILVYRKNSKSVPLFGGLPESEESQPLVKRTNSVSTLKFNKNSVETKLKDGIYKQGIYGSGSSSVKLLNDIKISKGFIKTNFELQGPFTWSQDMLSGELKRGTKVVINTKNFQPRVFRIYEDGHHKGLPSFLDGRVFSATTDDAYEHLKEIFGADRVFEYSKPYQLISFLINAATFNDLDSIILDSFAGTGTTAEAVLRLNKDTKGSNRKFILVELEKKIAKNITTERVKRVAKGYSYKTGNGKAVSVPGLGGGFEYVELGQPLFDKDGMINKAVSFEDMARYVYFTETRTNLEKKNIKGNSLGEFSGNHYFLLFNGIGKNILNRKFLKELKGKIGKKIIYADKCLLDEDVLEKYQIVFKQIPYAVKIY